MASLQAKQGLPLGTQIVGWATLGKYCFCSLFLAAFARHWTRELDDSCDTRHRSTFLSNIVYENRHQLLAMGIFASNAQSLGDVLTVMEHPWRSFRAQRLCTRIWLGAFLIFCLPIALFAASVFEICFRVPFKLLFKSRKWWLAARDEAYWYDCTYASPRCKLIVHLKTRSPLLSLMARQSRCARRVQELRRHQLGPRGQSPGYGPRTSICRRWLYYQGHWTSADQ